MSELRPAASDRAALIQRINELSNLARSAWFTLLGYLIFVGITLLSVRDADFFIPSRETQLPLVGVSIPTASFFWTAPVLGAALYTYLHLFLIKLWDAHAEARTSDAEPTHHWLVNDFVLIRQGDKVARARPMAWLVVVITFGLVWAAGPLVLAYAWFRSLPAHEEWLTLLIAACLALSIYVGSASWSRERAGSSKPPIASLTFWRSSGLIGAFLLLIASWDLTEGGVYRLYPADLRDAAFTDLPAGWESRDTARRVYRESWCQREGLEMSVCGQVAAKGRRASAWIQQDRRAWCKQHGWTDDVSCNPMFLDMEDSFEIDWVEERSRQVAALKSVNLSKRDLRDARADRAILLGANLSNTRLSGASFVGARMEGAILGSIDARYVNFSFAEMDAVDFDHAEIRRSAFIGTSLISASFRGASLHEVNLVTAVLDDADLSGAKLHGALLSAATLQGADLEYTRMEFVVAAAADFRHVKGLEQEGLDKVVGNVHTLLPISTTGANLFVKSCFPKSSEAFIALAFPGAVMAPIGINLKAKIVPVGINLKAKGSSYGLIRRYLECPNGQLPENVKYVAGVDGESPEILRIRSIIDTMFVPDDR